MSRWGSWGDHLGLVVAAAGGVFVAARLLSVARFDVTTAATVLQVAGVGTVVAGTTLTLLPLVVVLVAVGLAVVVYLDPTLLAAGPETTRTLLVIAVAVALCVGGTVPGVLVLGVVAALAVAARVRSRRAGPGRSAAPVDLRRAVADSRLVRAELRVLATALVLTPLVLQRPWLPVEQVTLVDGRVLVGYVLAEQDGRLTLMEEPRRSVRHERLDRVDRRAICLPAEVSGLGRELGQLTFAGSLLGRVLYGDDTPQYPACPSPEV